MIVVAADHNRIINPETSGIKRRFHSVVTAADQTVDSPEFLKPREKPRTFSEGDIRSKPSTYGACVNVSE